MKELTLEEALYKAAAYCSESEHCVSDVTRKLTLWGVPPTQQEDIITRLTAEKYIDEARYCRCFARDKMCYDKWGRIKIARSLWQKGIPESVSRNALQELDEEEYGQTLQQLLRAKARTVKASSDYERNGKLFRFAAGRGFEPSLISRYLKADVEDFE